jgi:hypothetical protein
VEATIQGFICNVTSTLKYENAKDEPIEAVFVFPLDDDSAVYHFEALIEDRKIVAECQEREQVTYLLKYILTCDAKTNQRTKIGRKN